MTDYDQLATEHGWTITRETIMGQPCTVYQRGRDVAVWWPHLRAAPGSEVLGGAIYNGRVLDTDLAGYLAASPRKEMLYQVIEGDQEGIIAHLAAMAAERKIQAGTTDTQRESRRLSDESSGLDLAVHVLQAWTGPQARMWLYGLTAEEWFHLASEGPESEVAPCCGNVGEVRDLLRQLMAFQGTDEWGFRLAIGDQLLQSVEADGGEHHLEDIPLLRRVLDGYVAEKKNRQAQFETAFPAPLITGTRDEP